MEEKGGKKERSLGITSDWRNLIVCAHGVGVKAGIRANRAALKSNPIPFLFRQMV